MAPSPAKPAPVPDPLRVAAHPPPSRRSELIQPFAVLEVSRAAAEHEERTKQRVLHMEIGQPNQPVLSVMADSAVSSLRSSAREQGYGPAVGMPVMRNAISTLFKKRYDVTVDPNEVIMTTGSSGAITALVLTAFNPGDRVAVTVPGYPCYRNILRALGVEIVALPAVHANNYQPTIDQIKAAHQERRLNGILVESPGNPTGAIMPKHRFFEILEFCAVEGVLFMSEEVYHGLARCPSSTAAGYPNSIVIGSFSKYWCMPGLRLGYLIVRDKALHGAIERALQNMAICAPTPSQRAAIAGIISDAPKELDENLRRYSRDGDKLVDILVDLGFDEVFRPDCPFYVWARCEYIFKLLGVVNSRELCALFLEKLSVAITPGIDFDPERGDMFVRFCTATSTEDIFEAAGRISKLVKEAKANANATDSS